MNTGQNFANGNVGDVAISTGNILSEITVLNENINSNIADVDCVCDRPLDPEDPPFTPSAIPPAKSYSTVQGATV